MRNDFYVTDNSNSSFYSIQWNHAILDEYSIFILNQIIRHEELLDSEGIYAEMWNQQSKQQTKSDNADEGENNKDSKSFKGKGVGKNGNSNIT